MESTSIRLQSSSVGSVGVHKSSCSSGGKGILSGTSWSQQVQQPLRSKFAGANLRAQMLKDKTVSTPALQGTILPGITRKSVIEVARSRGYEVHERLVSVDELMDADEVFCTGTAVVVSPVGSIRYLDRRVTYGNGAPGKVSQELYSVLTSIQMGLADDNMGWTVEVEERVDRES